MIPSHYHRRHYPAGCLVYTYIYRFHVSMWSHPASYLSSVRLRLVCAGPRGAALWHQGVRREGSRRGPGRLLGGIVQLRGELEHPWRHELRIQRPAILSRPAQSTPAEIQCLGQFLKDACQQLVVARGGTCFHFSILQSLLISQDGAIFCDLGSGMGPI